MVTENFLNGKNFNGWLVSFQHGGILFKSKLPYKFPPDKGSYNHVSQEE